MKRRDFITAAATMPLVLRNASASDGGLRLSTERSNTPPTNKPILDRYRLTRDRVTKGKAPEYTAEFLLEDVHGVGQRRFTNFSGDVSGRWISALATASSTYGERFPLLDRVVAETLRLQHEEGYFGREFHYANPSDDDLALLWGNGRLLVGLVEYFRLSQNPYALKAARRLVP